MRFVYFNIFVKTKKTGVFKRVIRVSVSYCRNCFDRHCFLFRALTVVREFTLYLHTPQTHLSYATFFPDC